MVFLLLACYHRPLWYFLWLKWLRRSPYMTFYDFHVFCMVANSGQESFQLGDWLNTIWKCLQHNFLKRRKRLQLRLPTKNWIGLEFYNLFFMNEVRPIFKNFQLLWLKHFRQFSHLNYSRKRKKLKHIFTFNFRLKCFLQIASFCFCFYKNQLFDTNI